MLMVCESVAKCPLHAVICYCTGSNGTEISVLFGIAGCPLLRGFEYIEIYGDTVRTFRNVHYIVSAIEGCLFHCNTIIFTNLYIAEIIAY